MKVIQFKNVWEMYRIKFVVNKQVMWENFWALKDINFEIEKGECIGIIGENGAGKSTILKLMAGMLKSDRGEGKVFGRVSGLLELGAGFHFELTGRENLYLNAGLFGLTEKEIDAKFESIAEFAGIGRFIDAPVKCYSQGMFVRLAFAIAIHMDPDILLIDDTLAVGDEDFQRKCIRRIFELKDQGKTIVCVTHDMGLLSRLCKRVIFLKEGRIIEDGKAERAISHYTETVGEKKGIGVMKKGSLRAVFNNGRLFLSWDGVSLTKGFGGHTCFSLIDCGNYDSTQADWQIEELSENHLVARGAWYRLPITQRWHLRLEDSGGVSWRVEMEAEKDDLKIKQTQLNLILSDQYSHWLSPEAEGELPSISSKDLAWEEVSPRDSRSLCVGLEGCYLKKDKLPCVVFEADKEKSLPLYAKVFNTDYFISARNLQLLNTASMVTTQGKSLYFSARILLDLPDAQDYMAEKIEKISLSKGPLKLIFKDGTARLFWNDVELTKGRGLHTSLFSLDRSHDSTQADWQIEELSENQLIAKGIWRRLPITQIWHLRLEDSGGVSWRIEMDVHRKIEIELQSAGIMLSEKYEEWFTSEKQRRGEFPAVLWNDWFDVIQGNVTGGFVGVGNFTKEAKSLPAVLLNISAEQPNNFVKIFNTDSRFNARALQLEKVEPETNVTFLPGKYHSFQTELLIEHQKEEFTRRYFKSNVLQQGHLKLILDQGKARLFWKDAEFTKRLCLYTSIRSAGRWHDSTQADWEIQKFTDGDLLLKGGWKYLPIYQFWKFRLLNKNTFEWEIEMEVRDRINVDREQTNIMLSEEYKEWIVPGKIKGMFPEFRNDIDDDWHRIWSGGSEAEIGVLRVRDNKKILPSIIFGGFLQGQIVNIVNSDIFYRGRLLQCLRQDRGEFIPGRYDYFSGRIILDTVK